MDTKQEYQVHKILPAIRRFMCKLFSDSMGYTGAKIARIMQLTPAAVSQYLNDKRGIDYKFNIKQEQIVRHYAVQINRKMDPIKALELCIERVYNYDIKNNTTSKPK